MQFAKGSILAAALLLAVCSLATASPPRLYGENPAARAELPTSRADVDYRLPNNTEPISYDIELTTNVHTGEKAFTGSVKIELMTTEATNYIVLHARQIGDFVVTVRPRDNPQSGEIPMTWEWEKEREFLTLRPVDGTIVMPANTYWILTLTYKGELREDNGGFYISSYTGEDGNTRYLATTQFESTDARHAFPCYDEPAKRALFTITINHSPTYTAISNMPVDTTKSSAGKTVFQQTFKMPSYLVAFIVSEFKYTEGVLNGLPQRIYSRPGTEHDQEFALVSGMLISERLGEYYNIRYPLPKLDQAAIPDFAAGAMENWGLATYREEYLLYNKHRSTVNTQSGIANIVGHEYTHMWFGDYVTVRWWTYLWLKEGFATLFSYHSSDGAYPEWGVWQTFHTNEYQRALANDGSPSPRPLTHYVQTPREISSLYDSVSYSKGGSFLDMFRHALGDEVFSLGLNKYLTMRGLDAGVEEDLFLAMRQACEEKNVPIASEIEAMMASWTRHGGFPLLTVTRNYADGSFKVKQEQFFNNEALSNDYTWYVPFNYIDATNWDFRDTAATNFLRKEKEITVPAKVNADDWLLLNKQSTGYFRVNYDTENWNKIIDGLWHMPYRFHPRNRAQLMHDAYYFATSKRLDHNTLLSMMLYLSKEEEYAPWSTANGILVTFNRYLSGDKNYADFQQFTAELVTDIYNKLGVNDVPGEQHFQKYTRTIAINLACLAGVKACLQDTNNKLKDSINNNIEIEPNLQSATYCNGLKQSGKAEFDHVFNKLMDGDDQAQRRLLISSLGCAQQEAQVKQFVESSIDKTNKLRTQERPEILGSAYSRGEVGLMASIEFLDKNWEEYSKLTPGFGGANPLEVDLVGMSFYCVNEEQKNKLNALVAKVKDAPGLSSTLSATIDTNIANNMKWLDQNRDPLISWIQTFRNSSASLTASFFTIAVAFFVTMSRYL